MKNIEKTKGKVISSLHSIQSLSFLFYLNSHRSNSILMPNVHAAAHTTTLHSAAAQTIGDCQPRPNRHENEEAGRFSIPYCSCAGDEVGTSGSVSGVTRGGQHVGREATCVIGSGFRHQVGCEAICVACDG